MLSRRNWLLTASLAAAAPLTGLARLQPAARPGRTEPGFRIKHIRRTTVALPYRPVPARNMARELPHWVYSEICEVELANGIVGFGETMLYYTWGATSDEDVNFAKGKNAAALLWDDELGAGLQMACFDAVARAMDVPIHALLGKQVNKRTPVAWWDIDLPPEDVAAEAKSAAAAGYTAFKTKGRPWFDIWEQAKQGNAAAPKGFSITFDYNDTLLDAERGIPILKAVEQYPISKMVETPIPQGDIPGNQRIRRETKSAVAMHYGNPSPVVAIRQRVCDGFVVGGGATRVMTAGRIAAMADMPFWLQLVGSSITGAWSRQFGAVLSHATWPAVTCFQLYAAQPTKQNVEVRNGFTTIPNAPGLGVELDWKVINQYKVPKPPARPEPARLLETRWPDGRKLYIGSNGNVNYMLRKFMKPSNLPYFEPGVTCHLLVNDGSKDWRDLYQRARRHPVLTR